MSVPAKTMAAGLQVSTGEAFKATAKSLFAQVMGQPKTKEQQEFLQFFSSLNQGSPHGADGLASFERLDPGSGSSGGFYG